VSQQLGAACRGSGETLLGRSVAIARQGRALGLADVWAPAVVVAYWPRDAVVQQERRRPHLLRSLAQVLVQQSHGLGLERVQLRERLREAAAAAVESRGGAP
jgi:hypothetical protein